MTEQIDEQTRHWLTHCPASDQNFISRLKLANAITIRAALKHRGLTLTARKALEAQLRVLVKAQERAMGAAPARWRGRAGSKRATRC